MDKVLANVGKNCIGMCHPCPPENEEIYSFGSKDSLSLFQPYLGRVNPVGKVGAFLNNIHYYPNSRWMVNERQMKKDGKWLEENAKNLMIYHMPLDLDQLAKGFESDIDLRNWRAKFGSQIGVELPCSTVEEYAGKIKQCFSDPYVLHHRGLVTPGSNRGYNYLFLTVGEKQDTKELSSLFLDYPEKTEEIITSLTGVRSVDLGNALGPKDTLVHFDTTRKPKKTVRKF